jgi:hypothetical protein
MVDVAESTARQARDSAIGFRHFLHKFKIRASTHSRYGYRAMSQRFLYRHLFAGVVAIGMISSLLAGCAEKKEPANEPKMRPVTSEEKPPAESAAKPAETKLDKLKPKISAADAAKDPPPKGASADVDGPVLTPPTTTSTPNAPATSESK